LRSGIERAAKTASEEGINDNIRRFWKLPRISSQFFISIKLTFAERGNGTEWEVNGKGIITIEETGKG
jgi:hypothetical protein